MPDDEHPPPQKPLDIEKLVEVYLEIRDAKKAFTKQAKAQAALFEQRLSKIENALHNHMQLHKLNSLPCDAGTAYLSTRNSASIADATAFRGYIIENRDWDLVDWRANPTAVEGFINEHDTLPPGVNWSSREVVNVRSKSDK
jgi:hypothetical protein